MTGKELSGSNLDIYNPMTVQYVDAHPQYHGFEKYKTTHDELNDDDFNDYNDIITSLHARAVAQKQLDTFVTIEVPGDEGGGPQSIDAHALVDSGCTGSCVDTGFVKRYNIPTKPLNRAYPIFNADGTSNDGGTVKEYIEVTMYMGTHQELIRLAVTSLASSNIFLGHDWLAKHNPEIDWTTGAIQFTRCPTECLVNARIDELEELMELRMRVPAKEGGHPTWTSTLMSSVKKALNSSQNIVPGTTSSISNPTSNPATVRSIL